MKGAVAEYALISQQPTALETAADPRLTNLRQALESRGFAVRPTTDMSGWLAYHAVFVASIWAALYHCGTDPQRLARDRAQLSLMCRAIPEGFRALRKQGRRWAPAYARHTPRSRDAASGSSLLGALHALTDGRARVRGSARHAEPEMRALAGDVLGRLRDDDRQAALRELLGGSA